MEGSSSPFGGIPRNWKQPPIAVGNRDYVVPPSGGSLEIGNDSVIVIENDFEMVFPLRGDP